jgi:plasmid stability protein
MATLTVRGLDDDLVRKLRIRAAEHGRSAEAEHREILRQVLEGVAKPSRVEIAERLAAFREATGDRTAGSVGDLLKESRCERMRQLTGLDADM